MGHQFVEILYLFLTLQDKYPTHRNSWAARQARETARRWITFANGHAPWDPSFIIGANTTLESENESKIAICDDISGWTVRTLKQDEEMSKNDPWGERRYAGWRAILDAFDSLRTIPDEQARDYSYRLTMTRLRLLQFVYGTEGMVKVSGLEDTS